MAFGRLGNFLKNKNTPLKHQGHPPCVNVFISSLGVNKTIDKNSIYLAGEIYVLERQED